MQMMQQMFGSDPAFNRAVQMAQGKNPQQIETVMKNLCEQRGMDFDQIKQTFNQFGMKL